MIDYRVTRTGVLLGLAVAFCALALAVGAPAPAARAADPGLQAAPSLLVSDCLEVDVGEQFDLSVKASGVSNLLAWEVYFAYNRHLLEVVSRDVHQLLDTGRNANVFDVSEPVPNSTGFYRMGAADLGPGDTPKQGDVLVLLTLQAKTKGVSPSTIFRGDYNGDGSIDFGPTLTGANTGAGPQYLGDADGDQRFDGAISSGQIAIGTTCVEPAPVLQPGESAAIPATPGSDAGNEEETTGQGTAGIDPDSTDDNGGTGTEPGASESGSSDSNAEDPQDPADAGNEQNSTTNEGSSAGNPRNPTSPKEGGIGGGILPWLLMGLGAAVAGAAGMTFYMMRSASREPY